ncbi:hypothetical protein GUJ93_ZPchr0011g27174 [Zizania palustris]|uniref:Epidermal patterning factor-like protein n=1 Tax=Zizania palustris TaxID=103762 RepID=A0A8J6BR61_ZIZPA|nr:hypothetical protein GUJ93_ZPchr0011g27174 [Zizania palustris]
MVEMSVVRSCCRSRPSWRWRPRFFAVVFFVVFFFFAAAVGPAAGGRPVVRVRAAHVRRLDSSLMMLTTSRGADDAPAGARRRLIGPGSSPPTCRARCGRCTPCRPVHVAIQPAGVAALQWEYYPEVWRCKCGDKLFMP